MSVAVHPGTQEHLVFSREIAPFFEESKYFSWEDWKNDR